MEGLLNAVVNVAGIIPAFSMLVHVFAFLAGMTLFVLGFMKFAKLKEANGRDNGNGVVIAYLVVGTLFMSLPAFYNIMITTVFQDDVNSAASSIFTYAPQTVGLFEAEEPRLIITSAVLIIQFIGLVGIIRGGFLLTAYSKQAIQSIMSPIVFLFAGAIAMNFPVFLGYLEQLFTT